MNAEVLLIGNIIGFVLQSFYYAYFLIIVKNIKTRKNLFIFCVFLEYIFLKCIHSLDYTINFELILAIMIYCMLKLIYKKNARITDVMTYIISILLLGIFSVITSLTIGMNIVGLVVANVLPILFTYLFRNKLIKIETFYNKFWNRHSNSKMLKSVTIRGFSSVITIITFLLMHIWLIYGILIIRR